MSDSHLNRDLVSPASKYESFTKDSSYKSAVEEYNQAVKDSTDPTKVINRDQDQSRAEWLTGRSGKWEIAGAVLCIAGALLAIGTAVVTIYDFYQYYHQDYAPIPRKIVHKSTDELGRFVYTAYDCMLCNREAQGFGKKDLEAYGDMNGDVGKQWLALYTTTDKAAGDPITADIIAQKGSNKFPADKANAAGSVVGTGVMVGSCVGSAALGALLCFLIVRFKRKDTAA